MNTSALPPIQSLAHPTTAEEQGEPRYWRASWAESDPRRALVHHYFFQANDVAEAHEKVFAWMRQPGHALPAQTRLVRDYWCSFISPERIEEVIQTTPKAALVIWRILWPENGEKHALLLFEPQEQAGAMLRAQQWAIARCEACESLEQFQMLERLPHPCAREAVFDPTEGVAFFAL